MKFRKFLFACLVIGLSGAIIGANGSQAADNPCKPFSLVNSVAGVCAVPGNTCNATTVTIAACTALQENFKYDFGGRDLVVASGGTLQIDPAAKEAPGEIAPWLVIEAGTVTVRNGGTIRGTGEVSTGANDNPSVIRIVADKGDIVEEAGGLIVSADRKLPGNHIILQTIATPGVQGAVPGNITIAGEIRANVQGVDIGGDPVYGGHIFLIADDPVGGTGGRITIMATGRIQAGATDPGGPMIFMSACEGIDIAGRVIAQGKSAKNSALEPFYDAGNSQLPFIFKINDVTAGIDEPLFISLMRFGGVFNPTNPAPNNPPLPLDNLGAAMSLMAAQSGAMVYAFSHEKINVTGNGTVQANADVTENSPPFQVGMVAFKARSDINIQDSAVIQANGAPKNAGFIDLLSLEGKFTLMNSAILRAEPLSFGGGTKPNNLAGKINVRSFGDLSYKDASQMLADGIGATGKGGVVNLQSYDGDVIGTASPVIDATGGAGNGTVTFIAKAPGPTGGGNVAPVPTKIQQAGVAEDSVERCIGDCACITRLQKLAGGKLKLSGTALGAVTTFFFKADCDPTGCPGAGCVAAPLDGTATNTDTMVTLIIPGGTPANSHVIGVSNTGSFCTGQTFNP